MTDSEIFDVMQVVVVAVSGLDINNVIPADDNQQAPAGPYASIKVGASRGQRGQANIITSNTDPVSSPIGDVLDVNHDIRPQLTVDVAINFYRGSALESASSIYQANKRPDISAALFLAGLGWKGSSAVSNLTALQSNEREERALITVTLLHEKSQVVTTNAIYTVQIAIENEGGDTIQVETVSGLVPSPVDGNLISADLGAHLIYIHNGITATTSTSFAAPANNLSSLTYDGANLISVDVVTDLIYIHSGVTATIGSSFAAPGGLLPRGLAYDGINLISADVGTGLIYIHSGITATISSSFATPGANTAGLTYDGSNLISADDGVHLIYIHSGVTATISSSFASPSDILTDITYDGSNLISADSGTDLIYIHSGITATISSSFATPSGLPYGLAYTGGPF